MKGFRKAAAVFLALVMVFAMPIVVAGDATIDDEGNITEENEELEGGIITLGAELDEDDEEVFTPATMGFGSVTGVVVESEREGFVAIETGDGGMVFFSINPYLTFMPQGEPEVGDMVIAFYNRDLPVPMIWPPQYGAVAIVEAGDVPPSFAMGRFGLDFVSECSRYRLNIAENTEIFLQDGQVITYEDGVLLIAGEYPVDTVRTMLVEYSISHRDYMPTTLFPERLTVLFEPIVTLPIAVDDNDVPIGIVPLPIELDEDELPIGIVPLPIELEEDELPPALPQVEAIDWGMYEVVVGLVDGPRGVSGAVTLALDDSILPNYVSLRAFVEFLGAQVQWLPGERIEMTNPNPEHFGQQISIAIGQNTADVDGTAVPLVAPPRLVGTSTFVHLSFFRDVLGFTNAFFEGGLVTIDNFERME